MFLLYVHMCCMYAVANNRILDQEDLNVIRSTNPGFRITVKTQEAPVLETKVAKFTQFILFWIYFSESVSNTKEHWCLIWHVMFPTRWINLGFNLCEICFNSVKHQHEHSDGCKEPFIGHSWTAKMNLQGILLSPKWTVSSEQLVIWVTCFVFSFQHAHLV